jgi:hypothetical protein
MTRVAGLPQTSSARAFDMYLKTRYIQEINNGGGVVFATGTPIANSVAEMFTMQRYLQMGTLHKQQVHHFDNWAATFGVAGLITQGVIDFMTDQSFLSSGSATGTLEYSLQNLMGLAFLGIWIIFSTIAAPVVIQKTVGRGHSAASEFFKGGFSAGRSAATTGATTLASGGAAGIKGAIAAGAMAAAAGTESLATASMNEGHGGGSLIGSLAEMSSRAHERERDKTEPKQQSFPPNDPSGDKTVGGMLGKSRNASG